jgi:long-chain acyl-CoA synthetase
VEKIWLKSYPPGVPHTIDPDLHGSLVSLIDDACIEFADRPAFTNFGSLMTFSEFDHHAAAFAAYLQNVEGLKPGERVALMMPNMLAYPVALLGVLRCGGVVVNTNPQYTARELAHQLGDSGARIIVVFENMLSTVAEVRERFPTLRIVIARIGDFMSWPKAWLFNRATRRRALMPIPKLANGIRLLSAIKIGITRSFAQPPIDSHDLAFLQYTGGTTGRSKGAMLSHRNIVANVLQVNAWFGALAVRGEEVIVTALPLYHIYALTGNCLAFVSQGGLNCLITDPRNLKTFIKAIKRVPFTTMSGVNTLFNALLQDAEFASVDFSTLKFTSGGGMAVQRAVADHWQRVTGSVIAEGYGLTESSPVVTVNRFDIGSFSGGIGLPVPSTEVRIVDADGNELGVEQAGELCVRGPQVMQGYWNSPEDTADTLDSDGWLSTGDIAVLGADGYLRIVDRKKDLILVSGFNVYPNEIEDIVVSHPGVLEAAAIGIADPKSGEALRLVLVRSDQDLEVETVVAWCREHLTAYKVPRSVVFADDLPKSNVGKILRREVRVLFGDA